MYSRLHFANYSLLRIRDLSGPYRHRCTPQKKSCWHKEGGKYMSLPDRIIHFTGIFSLHFSVWKINTLSSPASRVHNSLECSLWSADRTRNRWGVMCHLWNLIVICCISVPDNCFLMGKCFECVLLLQGFLMIILLLPLSFQYANHYLWLRCTE